MKTSHEHFLRECLGDSAVESLNKAISRQGHVGGISLEETYMSLMIVPRALLSWVSSTLRGLKQNDKLEVPVPGGKGATLFVEKRHDDDYKGYLHRSGEIIHRFDQATIPALSGHLMTVLELYDEFEDKHKDSAPIINDLVPLIDRMVEARIKTAPQPVININVNSGKEETPPIMPILPVMKEEANPNSDSFKVGYHMAMGNYHRHKGEKDRASQHDVKLDKCIKNVGRFSGIDKTEFDAGAEHATDCIAKGELSPDEADKGTDQYQDEREKLMDEDQQDEADSEDQQDKDADDERDKEQSGEEDKRNDITKDETAPTPPTPPTPPAGDKGSVEPPLSAPAQAKAPPKPEVKALANKTPADADMPAMKKGEWKDSLKGGLADKKAPKDFNSKNLKEGIKVEMEHTNDKKIATEIAMDHLTEDSNYYKKLKTIEKSETLSKADFDARCPDCGGREFVDEKFVGCICMGDMRGFKLKVAKNEQGEYELQFGKGWDKENIELLLDVLKRRNHG